MEVLKQGRQLKHTMTAFVRSPDKFTPPTYDIRLVQGDVLNAESLEAALVGQDVVISVFGHAAITRKPTTLLSDGTKVLVEAMKKLNVHRLICVTGIGAGNSIGHGGFFYDWIMEPLLLREIYRDKTRQEYVVRESGLEWVIARPAFLTNGPKTGEYRAVTDMTNFASSKISRADVADFVLKQINSMKCSIKLPS